MEEITHSRLSPEVLTTFLISNNNLMNLPLNIMINSRLIRIQAIKEATLNMEDRSALTIIKAAIKNPISRPITLMEVIRKITNISSTHKAVNSSDRAVATCNTDR